ncbi:putative transposase domain protein [Mycoplasmoides gallisepticum str. F]|nr:putative transposase domain protein [Mycoplasmoides gallisepticum str. F]
MLLWEHLQMYVYKDEHIQSHVFLCFLSIIVLKYCIYKLKKFYKDNGEIQKRHRIQFCVKQLINSKKKG